MRITSFNSKIAVVLALTVLSSIPAQAEASYRSLLNEVARLKNANKLLEMRLKKLETAIQITRSGVQINNLNVNNNLNVGNNLTVERNLQVRNNILGQNSLSVANNLTLNGGMSVNNLSVRNQATVSKNLNVAGNMLSNNELSLRAHKITIELSSTMQLRSNGNMLIKSAGKILMKGRIKIIFREV